MKEKRNRDRTRQTERQSETERPHGRTQNDRKNRWTE